MTGKRLDYIIIGLLVKAMLMFAVDRFMARDAVPTEDSRAEARQDQPTAAPTPDEKSIAVLPFVNMSEDTSNACFSEGMSEEPLNLLAQVPDQKLIARTSSFAFKGKDVPIA